MTLTARQLEILKLVRLHAPITGDQLAEILGTGKPTLRADLSLLVMLRLLEAKPRVGYFPGTAGKDEEGTFKRWETARVKDVQGLPNSVADSSTVHDAVISLFMGNAEALTVVDENRHFVGVVTPKDLLKVTLGNANPASLPVSMAMSRIPAVAAVRADQPLIEAVRKMLVQELDGLPVVSKLEQPSPRYEVIGWISKTNILRWMTEVESNGQE
ncbi:CBS domain-containing protein [Paenibacillus sacheonensis]|uniref:CBS domain-containing protein n=1 Tax=Paenibacillus sacheonensis TaxID=742054 RepID=A0A7X4YUF9_9BACL|nr:CBS domain-containing protein [Paenibacillus sacheonensis]MBM7569222.1 CBS domain-containing protein [Paenibacillus sacheonensis]NBC71766.1 CBS domain-containing protein [Paenibacillus sacheonensis]